MMTKAPLIYDRAMHEARKYWRDRLASMSFDGHIALDHPRRTDGERRLASLDEDFDADVHALLRRVTGGNHFLFYIALIAALQICCSKFSGRSNVTIFTPTTVDGGAVADLLPISATVDGEQSFKAALLATKETVSSAYDYQQYPFSRIVLDIPDALKPRPLAMVAAMAGFNGDSADDGSDIAVVFETDEASTKARFRFDRRLYEHATVFHFFKSLNAILRQALRDMATPIAKLQPHDDEIGNEPHDGDQATGKTTSTSAASGSAATARHEEDVGLCRLIEAQASAHPERVAVVAGDGVTTYGMLNQYADQLAQTLANLSLDRRKPIAIAMDASTELIVSMLAAAKIGVLFVPVTGEGEGPGMTRIAGALDCECVLYRRTNAAALLERRGEARTGVKHIVSVTCPAPVAGHDVPVVMIDVLNESSTASGAGASVRTAGQESAKPNGHTGLIGSVCCILGTDPSGDLFKSEVADIELVSLLQWLNRRCGINEHDSSIVLPGSGVCEQLYATLGMMIAGARVVIPDHATLEQGLPLAELLLSAAATVWVLPTAVMQNTLASLLALRSARPQLAVPRAILLSGEKQCLRLVSELARSFPQARITGLYAPSSVGLWSTYFPLDAPANANGGGVVARPIRGFAHLVLNQNGEPAPAQTKGELHLMRPCWAAGRPSGLRAKQLHGGRISWLRGAEHTFFKAGCWVELTDVEAALCQHEHILAAEVITAATEGKSDSIVMAVVLADPALVSAETAQDFLVLRQRVDLVPDLFVMTDRFPLTSAGAIDHGVLVGRYVRDHDSTDALSSGVDGIHKRLKVIWLEALQLEDVEDDDSFFALGGNSLKATLLMARIKDEFSVDLSVQDFFRKPTTRAVAQLIVTQANNAKSPPKGPDFKPVSRERYRVQLA